MLQKLIKLICDVKAMENAVMEMKYDAQKAPLGWLVGYYLEQCMLAISSVYCVIDRHIVFGCKQNIGCAFTPK